MITIKIRPNWYKIYDFGVVLMPSRNTMSLIFASIVIEYGMVTYSKPVSFIAGYSKPVSFIAGYDAREKEGCIIMGRNHWRVPFSVR